MADTNPAARGGIAGAAVADFEGLIGGLAEEQRRADGHEA
jgi:hypothetical protein